MGFGGFVAKIPSSTYLNRFINDEELTRNDNFVIFTILI